MIKKRVFLDTNIILKEAFFRSTIARAFLKASIILGVEIILPEIVVDEVKGNFRKQFLDKRDKFLKAQKQLKEFTKFTTVNPSEEKVVNAYEKEIDKLLSIHDVKILPYPQIKLKDLVEKSYKSEKPFKENGDGHKDFIIWQSIFQFIINKNDKVVNFFITNNDKDFFEKKDSNFQFFPSLRQQFATVEQIPKIYQSLKDFFDDEMSPMLTGIDINELAELSVENLKIQAQAFIEEDLTNYVAFGLVGIQFESDITVSSVLGDIENFNVSLKSIGADEILIVLTGDIEIEVDGFMEKHSYYSEYEDLSKIHVINRDHNDWVMSVSTSIVTPFELRLTYDREKNSISDHEIELLHEITPPY